MRTENGQYKISEEVKNKLLDAITTNDFHKYREFGDNFFTTLIEEMKSDDEAWEKKGVALVRAIINEDIDGIFMALCGWCVETLIELTIDPDNNSDIKINNIEEDE